MMKLIVFFAALAGSIWATPCTNKSQPILDGRIVGGDPTTIEDYPYIVSVLENDNHICGGSIISSTWILTAAHCLLNASVSVYSIRAGSTICNSGGQVISSSKTISHSSYNEKTHDYDIGLIRLSSAITISNAQVITLAAEDGVPTAGLTATITGWGNTFESESMSDTLQVVEVPIVSQDDCTGSFGSLLTDRMFCAGILGIGGKDACQYDSGGPLVVNDILAGITSWGVGCGWPDYPGVYTSIPSLRTWIKENSGI